MTDRLAPYRATLGADPDRWDRAATYIEDRVLELAGELECTARSSDLSVTHHAALEDAAHLLRLLAAGALEVIRCTCELYGVATCPTCGGGFERAP